MCVTRSGLLLIAASLKSWRPTIQLGAVRLGFCPMKRWVKSLVLAAGATAFSTASIVPVRADRFDDIADGPMSGGRPTAETTKSLKEELLFQRATQVYLWAMPLINTLGMKYGSEQTFGAGYNVLPIWKDRLNAKTLVTTPNSDVLYAMSYADLGETGPLVFDAPPRMQGILLDFWQRPIPGPKLNASEVFAGDVGFFGPDGGKGGKFLILPPGYNDDVPDGYYVFRSGTKNVFIFLRAFFEDPECSHAGGRALQKSRFYPLGQEGAAKPMQFPNASDVPVNMLPRSDATAFDQLKWLIDHEPDSIAGEEWLGMLAAIGIERGKPFQPDAATRRILDRAAETGYKTSRVIGFESAVAGVDYRVYPDRQWLNPMASGYPYDLAWTRNPGGYRAVDIARRFFTNYYSISPGMVVARRCGRQLPDRVFGQHRCTAARRQDPTRSIYRRRSRPRSSGR